MDRMCVPLLVPATSLVWVLFVIITRGLAWASRAVVFHICSVLAFAQAVAVVALLCRYLRTWPQLATQGVRWLL
jgi:hypothetical protein